MRHRFTALVVLTILSLPLAAIAQLTSLPDTRGDYYRNDAPQRVVPSSEQFSEQFAGGSLWQVVSVGLNCRRSAGTGYLIVRQFFQGDRLQVEVGRGGSDEVLQNPIDRNGKPWMPVRGESPGDVCYVRANSRYIQPLNEEP